jgi:hypothetical protein
MMKMETMCYQATIRGKFFRPAENLQAPVQLDQRVYQCLSDRAQSKGMSLESLVNDILKQSIVMAWRMEH